MSHNNKCKLQSGNFRLKTTAATDRIALRPVGRRPEVVRGRR